MGFIVCDAGGLSTHFMFVARPLRAAMLLLLLMRLMLGVRAFMALALRMRDRKVPDRALGFDMKDVVVVVQVDTASTIELEQTLHTLFRVAYTKLTHVVVMHEPCDTINSHQRDADSRNIKLIARTVTTDAPKWGQPMPIDGSDVTRHTVWVRAGVALPASLLTSFWAYGCPSKHTAITLQPALDAGTLEWLMHMHVSLADAFSVGQASEAVRLVLPPTPHVKCGTETLANHISRTRARSSLQLLTSTAPHMRTRGKLWPLIFLNMLHGAFLLVITFLKGVPSASMYALVLWLVTAVCAPTRGRRHTLYWIFAPMWHVVTELMVSVATIRACCGRLRSRA